jgi:hypothetical protein
MAGDYDSLSFEILPVLLGTVVGAWELFMVLLLHLRLCFPMLNLL